jgi:hypothetical protein
MSDIEDQIVEKVGQSVITIEDIKELLETLKAYTLVVDAVLEDFEERIALLEL